MKRERLLARSPSIAMPRRWTKVDVGDAALKLALDGPGFLSLEVTEEPFDASSWPSRAIDANQDPAAESSAPSGRAKANGKKSKKRKLEGANEVGAPAAPVADVLDGVELPDDDAADGDASKRPKKAKKKKKQKQVSGPQQTASDEAGDDEGTSAAASADGPPADLFASLTAELAGAAAAKAKAAADEERARAALNAAKRAQAEAKAKAKAKAKAVTGSTSRERGHAGASLQNDEARDGPDLSHELSGWSSFGLHEHLLRGLAAAGFVAPTPIQRECLPAAIHGHRDVIGAAETGSGKTLAFGLPILQRLLAERPELTELTERSEVGGSSGATRPLFALIVTPTRELAAQVASHIQALSPPAVQVRAPLSSHQVLLFTTPR